MVIDLTTVQDVVDEMASIADSNIEDPVEMRRNDNEPWVFSHFPKIGEGKNLPRIGFHSVDESHPQVTLGSTRARTEADIQCTIVVKRGRKYDYDDDGDEEEEENLIHYLKDEVKTALKDNQTQIKNLDDVNYVIPLNTVVRKPEGKNIIFMSTTYEARIDG